MYMDDLKNITPERYPPKDSLLPGAFIPEDSILPAEPSKRRTTREIARRFTPEPIPSERLIAKDAKTIREREEMRTEEGPEGELQVLAIRSRMPSETDWELAEEGGQMRRVENEQNRILDGLAENAKEAADEGIADEEDLAEVESDIKEGSEVFRSEPDVERALIEEETRPPKRRRREPPDDVLPPPVAPVPQEGETPVYPIRKGWHLSQKRIWGRVICRDEAIDKDRPVEYDVTDSISGRKIEHVKFNAANCRIELKKGFEVESVASTAKMQGLGKRRGKSTAIPPPDESDVEGVQLRDKLELGDYSDFEIGQLEATLDEQLGMPPEDKEKGVGDCGCKRNATDDVSQLMELGLGSEADPEKVEKIEDLLFDQDQDKEE
jgi:hypothetical protein